MASSSGRGRLSQLQLDLLTVFFERMRAPTSRSRSRSSEPSHLEEGLEKGFEKGRAKGLAEGRAEGRRDAIRTVLEARGIHLSATQLRQLDRCEDLAVLDDWVQRAARAKTANDIFPPATRKRRSPTRARAPRATKG